LGWAEDTRSKEKKVGKIQGAPLNETKPVSFESQGRVLTVRAEIGASAKTETQEH
jgi:hypothetical protein